MTRDLILTFNAGSSTIKLGFYALEIAGPRPLASGVIDFRDASFAVRLKREDETLSGPISADPGDLTAVLNQAFAWLAEQFDLSRLAVIGHRVVHGGDVFKGPARITDQVIAQIDALARLAPLHQPQSLALIRVMRALYPDVPQTASFDTAFHATNPPLVRRFAIPRALYDQGIKRYGFHGLSYHYIAGQLGDLAPEAKVVAAHLGSGASLCAIHGGISIDSSMGFSTLDGIPMATRSGALDPGVILHLMGEMGQSLKQLETMLYRESGLLGVSGFEADSRELMASPRPEAAEAIDLFCLRIAGEVARLATSMGGIDALIFTAGIGEHQPGIRSRVATRLAWLGTELDPKANEAGLRCISTATSRVKLLVIPTDEESIIAREAISEGTAT
ncbi:acetate/propionate family kinase [Haematobacter massiliensis]|uniref:acetate/propionate family kinase n=1 Tax=Haematobacter massiliensis TaxID=195105 RepID=UPI00103E903E|nr:acetate/propionate family kinase [Haematobacter massiliensis]QBJ22980.1 acetate/propionate family kinase [Haematobacter massiliensis]